MTQDNPNRDPHQDKQPVANDDLLAWRRVARALRISISNGDLRPGTPAPSITDLVRTHGSARPTCAMALRSLEGEGLLVRRPGLGYYIADDPQ